MLSGRIPVRVAGAVRRASNQKEFARRGLLQRDCGTAGNAPEDVLRGAAYSSPGLLSTRAYAVSGGKDGRSGEGASSSKTQLKPRNSQEEKQSTRPNALDGSSQKDPNMRNEQQHDERSSSGGQKEQHFHSAFPTTVKPDPSRMWEAIGRNPDYDEASSDAGGYIKRVDTGLDQAKVDETRKELNEKDTRLKGTQAQERTSASTSAKSSARDYSSKGTESSQTDGRRQAQSAEKGKTHELKGGEFITPDQDNRTNQKRTVSNAQQSVVWENTPRSTSGGSQVSSDNGGVGQLTEQLLDRDAARSSLEADKSVSTQEVGNGSKKGSKKKNDKDEDTSSSSSSESDSDSEGRKREKKLKKQQKLKKQ